MKRKSIIIFLILILVLTFTSCSSDKKVKTKADAKRMAVNFYGALLNADKIKMSTYNSGELLNIFTKDNDKMHVEIIDPEYGYDYYLFKKDGVKYLIADDKTLFEDEAMYDMSNETINNAINFSVLAYFDIEDDSFKYTAVERENELELTIKGKFEDSEYLINNIGKKENGVVTSIVNNITYGEETLNSEYLFEYDQHIELPEYSIPKRYDNLPHVDSPYERYADIIYNLDYDEELFYSIMDDKLLVIDEVDGRHYQFSSSIDQEIINTYNNLDFFADDYNQQIYDLISDIEIEDCIDFTDEILNSEQLSTYTNKTIQNIINDGFEVNGYSFFEDHNCIYLMKDSMTYKADVILPDSFNPDAEFEYDAFNDFIINDIKFDNPEYSILPMR